MSKFPADQVQVIQQLINQEGDAESRHRQSESHISQLDAGLASQDNYLVYFL
jgi:hypothetical protein